MAPWSLKTGISEGVPICGYTGVNGAGKTLLAVQDAIVDMRRGREVYSTVNIRAPREGGGFYQSQPIRSLRQLLELENCTVLLDEVSVIFSSRSSQSLPAEVVALLQTLRHKRVTVRWTAPAWMRCDNLLREVTQGVVNVVPFIRRRSATDPWPRPLIVMAALLDTTTGKSDAVPTKVLRRGVGVLSRLDAFGSYDTHADTPLLGRHLQPGACVDCGGSIERPKHSQARHEALGLPWYPDEAPRVPAFVDEAPAEPAAL